MLLFNKTFTKEEHHHRYSKLLYDILAAKLQPSLGAEITLNTTTDKSSQAL